MVAKTDFSEKDLNSIIANYDLGELQDFKPFEKGADQTNILLVTSTGKFAFRYYEKRSVNYVEFEINLLEHLAKHSYPSPIPIKNRQGTIIEQYNCKPFAIFSFLKGEHSDSKENYRQVAQAVAKLHIITEDYRPPHYEIRNPFSAATCLDDASLNARKISSEKEAAERLSWLKAELKKVILPNDLPIGVCRGDTNPTNFLYKSGKLSAVLDFDQASYSYLICDVANIVGWWMWPDKGELNFSGTREVIKEYEKVRVLTAKEKNHLYDALKMLCASGIGWSIHSDEEYFNTKRKIEILNSIGKDGFKNELLN